ncbi:MAG: hypothetical protein AAI946_00485 [Candidatus Hodgkinia cicadicola]
MCCPKASTSARLFGLLAVNKSVSVLTQAALAAIEDSRLAVLRQLILVNRIDLLTSGLTGFSVRRASVKLRCKLYLCLINRLVIGLRSRVSCWLTIKRRWKLCVSYFVLRSKAGVFALARAVLVTGRKRQLRRQLSSLSVNAGERSWCLHSATLWSVHAGASACICASVL